MLTVYLNKSDIPKTEYLVNNNDAWFNTETMMSSEIEKLYSMYIPIIDGTEYLGNMKISCKFNSDIVASVSEISTGCKTLLNIACNKTRVFNVVECGWNAIDEIVKLKDGKIYMPYNFITELSNPIKVVIGCKEYVIRDTDEYIDFMEGVKLEH